MLSGASPIVLEMTKANLTDLRALGDLAADKVSLHPCSRWADPVERHGHSTHENVGQKDAAGH